MKLNTRISFRIIPYLLGAFIYFLSSCKTVSFYKYFPLEKDKKLVYLKRIDSTNVESLDTLVCRKAIAKQTRTIRADKLNLSMADRANHAVIGKLNIYFFEKIKADPTDNTWMNDHSFAEKIYCFADNKLYVGGWDEAMSYDTELDFLFPKRLKKKTYYKYKNGDYCKSFEYVGKETLIVDEKRYRHCIKIDIFETLGHTNKIASVWFAKNTGLVKWTGLNERVKFIRP